MAESETGAGGQLAMTYADGSVARIDVPAHVICGHRSIRELCGKCNGAEISKCGLYRYALWRTWDNALPVAVFVMLNPSTADARENDPTIRKCIGFAKRWGCGGIHVVNLFAFRATKPSALLGGFGPTGAHNTLYLRVALRHSSLWDTERVGPCVVAWGTQSTKRLRAMIGCESHLLRNLAAGMPVPLQCLGTAKDGNPRHPLMLAYATELQPWTC